MVNSIGNLGGSIGPYTIGAMKDGRFGYTGGLTATALMMALGAVLVVVTKSKSSGSSPGRDYLLGSSDFTDASITARSFSNAASGPQAS